MVSLLISVYSFFAIFRTNQVINFFSRLNEKLNFLPFSEYRKRRYKKRWFYIFTKICFVIIGLMSLLFMALSVQAIIS